MVKFSTYLNRHVFVMYSKLPNQTFRWLIWFFLNCIYREDTHSNILFYFLFYFLFIYFILFIFFLFWLKKSVFSRTMLFLSAPNLRHHLSSVFFFFFFFFFFFLRFHIPQKRHFIFQEKFNILIYGINLKLKCGT